MAHVLIVDDEPTICWGFRELLTDEGHRVSVAPSAEDGLAVAEHDPPDAIVLDVCLPGLDGLSAIARFRSMVGSIPILIITAFGNLDTAVKAVQQGAYDYLTKPFELQEVTDRLRKTLESTRAKKQPVTESALAGPIIGRSPVMQVVFKQIALVASREVPVLITGETGTGKELVAEAIHRHSKRSAEPFLPVCLAALSPQLIESELFGHRRGAFTGAERDRVGLLELAQNGTVFLDEIGDVDLAMQVKLLRAIEKREIHPVGDPRPRQSNFRIVAATNRNLAEMVEEGTFREDLFYRLSVFPIQLPPLRDRKEDIPLLLEHFLKLASGPDSDLTISDALVSYVLSRPWNGNVRELRNALEHAAIVACDRPIQPEHFPPPIKRGLQEPQSINTRLEHQTRYWAQTQTDENDSDQAQLYEKFQSVVDPVLFSTVLEHCDNNQAAAARVLGIHRATLREKLRRYGLKGRD